MGLARNRFASRSLPATAEVLGADADGMMQPLSDLRKAVDKAKRKAGESGFRALLLVGLQPVMSDGLDGFEALEIRLRAVTELHALAPAARAQNDSLLLTDSTSVTCVGASTKGNASEFRNLLDGCLDKLVARLQGKLAKRLENR